MSDPGLEGRVAVVTGGGRGIGRAVADRLADAGAVPVVWDLEPPETRSLAFEEVDVTSPAALEAAAERTLDRHGRIDILVCSAGIHGPIAPVETYPLEAWRRVLEVDLTGIFLSCRAVLPAMRRAGYGRIVLLASVAGKEGTANAAAYSAAKGGVIAFTKALGKELAGTGILVNAVAPGPVETGMIAAMPPAHLRVMLSKCPLGRVAKPEEAAELIAWLASEACSYNTGAVFDLSGGRATW